MTDARIFFYFVPAMFVLFGIFLVALSLADRSLKAARWGAMSFFCGALGILIDALRPVDDEWLRHLALTLHFVTIALFLHAFAQRHRERVPVFSLGVAVVACLALLPYGTVAIPRDIRLVLVQLVALSMILPILPRAMRWQDGRVIGALVVGALSVSAVSYGVRAIMFMAWPDTNTTADFFGSFYNVTFHLTTALIGFALGMILLIALGSDAVRRENQESERDPLTGLGNRRALHRALAADEAGKWRCGGVIAIDLDHFKTINDRFGHDGGDRVLVAVADALRFVFRGQRICRLGGEEFLVMVDEDRAAALAGQSANALAAIESLTFPAPLDTCRVSACVGHARRGEQTPIEDAMRRADLAVYKGKNRGRGQVNVADGDEPPVAVSALG